MNVDELQAENANLKALYKGLAAANDQGTAKLKKLEAALAHHERQKKQAQLAKAQNEEILRQQFDAYNKQINELGGQVNRLKTRLRELGDGDFD